MTEETNHYCSKMKAKYNYATVIVEDHLSDKKTRL